MYPALSKPVLLLLGELGKVSDGDELVIDNEGELVLGFLGSLDDDGSLRGL